MKYNPVTCVLDLMRRLPPQKLETNIEALCDITPEYADTIYDTVEKPLQVATCKQSGKEFLCCDFNRDGDSYRSPWSNQYDPPIESEIMPTPALRQLEEAFNQSFDVYRKLYYDGGISSVYLWDQKKGFSGSILIKKVNDSSKKVRGAWDSIHTFEATVTTNAAHYKLSSTVMLYTLTSNPNLSTLNLSGNIRRNCEHEAIITSTSDHVVHLGQLIEEAEAKIRNTLQEVYFDKTKEVVNQLRSVTALETVGLQSQLKQALANSLSNMKIKDTQVESYE